MAVGISFLIAIKAATLFLCFSFLRDLGFKWLALPFLYASLISFLVSIASHPSINLPMLLGKSSDGHFPIWSMLIFSPYLYFVRIFSALRRLRSGEPPYNEVSEGIYVGGWPSSVEKMPPGNPAVIDCTCELPRKTEISKHAYMCVPTWDTRSPQPAEIDHAVKWACRKRAQNCPVFIHCAYGHGRSVAVTCALLVALGVANDWKSAEKLIKEKRPYIRMNALHRQALEEWSKHRLSTPTRKEEIGLRMLPKISESKMTMKVEAGDDGHKCYKIWNEYKGNCPVPKDKECFEGCKKEAKMMMEVEAGDDGQKCYKIWNEYRGNCPEPKDKECFEGCKKEGKMIMKVEAGDDDKKDKCYKVWEEYKGGCKEYKDKECEDGCKKEGFEKSACIKDKEKKEGDIITKVQADDDKCYKLSQDYKGKCENPPTDPECVEACKRKGFAQSTCFRDNKEAAFCVCHNSPCSESSD
ncbi:OLC1v1026380C1 [Oldenlandia corymbosa var. corymbosa]|uniref:OLC1v1026380C1 n=1 Tax=Oldenlandia corymbosa var. corymbosa TaxID=529605 RepID=A0AAV1C6V4_OLDCO|nr:OLC1v1026380C1 [Oldenlandia corymbosa var. corymbosa]